MKTSKTNKSVWRKIRTIVLLPLAIFLWMIGWALYCVGDREYSQEAPKNKQ